MLTKIQNGLWDEALQLLIEKMRGGILGEEDSILGATILEHFEDWDGMYDLITHAIARFPQNYELYLLLGNYYRHINSKQAFLCYENALFFCEKYNGSEEDRSAIRDVMQELKDSDASAQVPKTSFVILSYNELGYTRECIESIRDTCYQGSYEIIVVDNASTDDSVTWLKEQPDVKLIVNKENQGFPRGCNQGIEASGEENDIFLLNNDTVMQYNSLFLLRMGLYESEDVGATGAVTNYAGNNQMVEEKYSSVDEYRMYAGKCNIPTRHPYELKSRLIMFAMLVKRVAMNKIGMLDERFSPGNFEDDDYGIRMMLAGYKMMLCHNSFILHYGSVSFGKDPNKYNELMQTNAKKYIEKWNVAPGYFSHVRTELLDFINEEKDAKFRVLEVGCGMGETLARIQYMFPNCDVHGIELQPEVVAAARNKLDIVEGNIETYEFAKDEKYDYIIFADVLEHLRDPEEVLTRSRELLKEGGHILTSIPNLMNARVIYNLLHGSFTYQDAGILDRTHLRFFTRDEVLRMFGRTEYIVENMLATVFEGDSTACAPEFFDQLCAIEGVGDRALFDVYQFILSAKKK